MQLRDPVYVDDVVDALLRSGLASTEKWRVYNIGGPEALTIAQIANTIRERGAHSSSHNHPVSVHRSIHRHRRLRVGLAACQGGLQWEASTRFECGIKKAIEYYEACAGEYLTGVDPRL